MNKILEEFRRIKTERNQFVNETNKKGEILFSQAKNKFDSVNNSILEKNINKKNSENENNLDMIKIHLSKAINFNHELFSYNSYFNYCFKDLILFLEKKIKDILNKNDETIIEEENKEHIQNIIKLANLTKILVEENINIIKGESNPQKANLLIQLKDNLNIIYNNLSPDIISNNNINKKSIIDNISKLLNYLSENIIFIYNDFNSINYNYYGEGENNISNYLLNSIFNNNFNIYRNTSNSKIWKLIATKNNNQEITLSQSNFKLNSIKKYNNIPKNYSIHIYIEKSNNINTTIKLMKYLISYVKNKIMIHYVITNNFKSKIDGYYCFEIFGVGKRKKKIIKNIKNKFEKISKISKYNNICIMIKISLYNEFDILMKKKFFNLLKKEFYKLNDKNEDNKNKNIININYLMDLVKKDVHYNFNDNIIEKYLNPNNIIE